MRDPHTLYLVTVFAAAPASAYAYDQADQVGGEGWPCGVHQSPAEKLIHHTVVNLRDPQ